jgi:hypothetical protein
LPAPLSTNESIGLSPVLPEYLQRSFDEWISESSELVPVTADHDDKLTLELSVRHPRM